MYRFIHAYVCVCVFKDVGILSTNVGFSIPMFDYRKVKPLKLPCPLACRNPSTCPNPFNNNVIPRLINPDSQFAGAPKLVIQYDI